MILITGGTGFIGSNFVLEWFGNSSEGVVNRDRLTYAGNLENLAQLADVSAHRFVRGDIDGVELVANLQVACPEEIAFRKGLIDADALHEQATFLAKNGYGQYLMNLLK
jgi:dTDP-glucose 4,6-dehydratase